MAMAAVINNAGIRNDSGFMKLICYIQTYSILGKRVASPSFFCNSLPNGSRKREKWGRWIIFAVMIQGLENRIFEAGKAGAGKTGAAIMEVGSTVAGRAGTEKTNVDAGGAGASDFTALALEVFQFQYQNNALYRSYTDLLGVDPAAISAITQIPFLPVSFFKTHSVRTTAFEPEVVFESSGTTGTGGSRHEVRSLPLYKRSFLDGFEHFYGPVGDWCIIGLLPAYLERSNSSLVVMVDELIRRSGHPESGFYLYEHDKLYDVLRGLEGRGQKTLLIGVTFALLDFAEAYSLPLRHTIVMETGGMKGRRKEITRQELHGFLTERLGLKSIHAEYGMTELLSQAYSAGHGLFEAAPWMKVLVRKEDDPLAVGLQGEGILNVIDLANLYSCAFLATEDIGKIYADGRFDVSGRVDNSDIRGCSQLVV
jgi:hypothetical protein